MEEQRKEETAQAVAAVEAAEDTAVLEAMANIAALTSSGNTSGVVEVSIETEAGPVQIALLSTDALAEAGGAATVSAGEETGAKLEISSDLLGEVAAAAGSSNVLLSASTKCL